jgi:DNA-binding transcriptional regulator YiaG
MKTKLKPRVKRLRTYEAYKEWRNNGLEMQLLREKCGISATEIAGYLGITLCFLRDMEKGNRRYADEYADRVFTYCRR